MAPENMEGVWLAQPNVGEHYDPGNAVRVEAGHIPLPHSPGLGVRPDDGIFADPVASFS